MLALNIRIIECMLIFSKLINILIGRVRSFVLLFSLFVSKFGLKMFAKSIRFVSYSKKFVEFCIVQTVVKCMLHSHS